MGVVITVMSWGIYFYFYFFLHQLLFMHFNATVYTKQLLLWPFYAERSYLPNGTSIAAKD